MGPSADRILDSRLLHFKIWNFGSACRCENSGLDSTRKIEYRILWPFSCCFCEAARICEAALDNFVIERSCVHGPQLWNGDFGAEFCVTHSGENVRGTNFSAVVSYIMWILIFIPDPHLVSPFASHLSRTAFMDERQYFVILKIQCAWPFLVRTNQLSREDDPPTKIPLSLSQFVCDRSRWSTNTRNESWRTSSHSPSLTLRDAIANTNYLLRFYWLGR